MPRRRRLLAEDSPHPYDHLWYETSHLPLSAPLTPALGPVRGLVPGLWFALCC